MNLTGASWVSTKTEKIIYYYYYYYYYHYYYSYSYECFPICEILFVLYLTATRPLITA
jgi:hypothetical protein